jgi:hypothetical protein
MSKIQKCGPDRFPNQKRVSEKSGSEMDWGSIYRGIHLKVLGLIQLRKVMIS